MLPFGNSALQWTARICLKLVGSLPFVISLTPRSLILLRNFYTSSLVPAWRTLHGPYLALGLPDKHSQGPFSIFGTSYSVDPPFTFTKKLGARRPRKPPRRRVPLLVCVPTLRILRFRYPQYIWRLHASTKTPATRMATALGTIQRWTTLRARETNRSSMDIDNTGTIFLLIDSFLCYREDTLVAS